MSVKENREKKITHNRHVSVTWYGDASYAGKSGLTSTGSFILKVPVSNLRISIIYLVPCDRIVLRRNVPYSIFIILLLFIFV